MLYNFDMLSFQILTVDRFFHKEGFFDVKARPYAALSFRERGTGNFNINGKSFFVKPGDVLFIPANTPYEVEYSVSESIVANLTDCNYCDAELFDLKASADISLSFLRLLDDWQNGASFNRAKATVYEILEKIGNDKRLSEESSAFSVCLKYIEDNFCDPSLDISSVCKAGFTSPSSLQRSFLRRLGISPKQYITKLRMTKALRLLAENRLSVKETSFSCGYADEKYFSRVFKERYGYPPSHLRDSFIL